MKKTVKYLANHFRLALALSMVLVSGCSCSAPKPTPDPLAGWKLDFKKPDQAVIKDYQDYIHNLPPNESGFYHGPASLYEDGTGQHAFKFESYENNEDWSHVLIYDRENKRIKTLKYNNGRIMS
jgi:hypothetical protein